MTTEKTYFAPGQSPCACWPGRLCNRSAECSADVRATPAPAPADHATVEQWEAALTAVMPSDFKDWHQNSRREWPNIAAHVIGNLRQREDEAWATVERLTATAPAPATGKPGLHVAQAPAVPVGAEPVSLDAAVRLGLEYAREALATHDQQFANHPATALERGSIVADIATMEASLASPVAEDRQETIIGHSVERGGWCVYSHYHGGDYTFEMGPFATREGAEAAVRAPQAPQQAGHIPTVEDIDAQDWAGMDGTTAWHLIDRHGEDWSHIGRLMAAWLAANQAPGMQHPNAGDWRTIETAPKDQVFLGWIRAERWSSADGEGSGRSHDVSQGDFCWWQAVIDSPDGGYFDNGAGQVGDAQEVTHWMPLLSAPDSKAQVTSTKKERP